jgi:ketosteroid isomerase-like protein
MSQTSLKLIADAYAAFGTGDLPAMFALMSDDIEWTFVGDSTAPYTGTFKGKDDLPNFFIGVGSTDLIEAFEPREFFAADGHVTVLGWEKTADKTTGKVFTSEWIHLWVIANDRITRFWGTLDTQAAAASRS